jgi:hypothetical protein
MIVAVEQTERHQRIEEVASATPIDGDPVCQLAQVKRPLSQGGENPQLDRTQQHLGFSKGVAELHDAIWRNGGHVHDPHDQRRRAFIPAISPSSVAADQKNVIKLMKTQANRAGPGIPRAGLNP